MISAATIALLIDAGLSGQTLKDVTAAFERDLRHALRVTRQGNNGGNTHGNSDAGEPTPAALKMRKYREKQRELADAEASEAVTNAGNSVVTTDNNISLDTQSKKEVKKDTIVGSVTRKRNDYPEDFEKFWAEYPTDDGMSKKQAATEWAKLSAEDRALAVNALPHFRVWVKKQSDNYRTIHACRYLSYRRFEGFKAKIVMAAPRADRQVWVKRDSDAGDAWDRYWKKTHGKAAPLDQNGGWYFPTEYPQEQAA